MEALPLIKLAIDIALAGAVFYLAARVGRRPGPSAAHIASLQVLEENLSRLLKDAGGASADLHAALGKEQKKLEELLFDIETVEYRINKGLDEAKRTQREMIRAEPAQPQAAAPQQEIAPQPIQQPAAPQYVQPQPASVSHAPIEQEPVRSEQRIAVNIYGEPIHPTSEALPRSSASSAEVLTQGRQFVPEAASNEARSLRQSIEREIVEPRPEPVSASPKPVQQSLEDIYAQCEELLRAGNSIQQVSNAMNLSIDEIETLQQVMDVEEEPASVSNRSYDQRLGALSRSGGGANPIGRSTQVIS